MYPQSFLDSLHSKFKKQVPAANAPTSDEHVVRVVVQKNTAKPPKRAFLSAAALERIHAAATMKQGHPDDEEEEDTGSGRCGGSRNLGGMLSGSLTRFFKFVV